MDTIGTDSSGYLLKLKTLSDETRLNIINLLSGGPLCACDILESFQITQPTLSYHMKLLTSSNLVSSKKNGKWIYYSVEKVELDNLTDYLNLISSARKVDLVRSSEPC